MIIHHSGSDFKGKSKPPVILAGELGGRVSDSFQPTIFLLCQSMTAEGIAAAKLHGVQFGQKAAPVPDGFGEVQVKLSSGELSATAAGKCLGAARNTFLNRTRPQSQQQS